MAALHWCRKLTGNEDTSPQVCVCPPRPVCGTGWRPLGDAESRLHLLPGPRSRSCWLQAVEETQLPQICRAFQGEVVFLTLSIFKGLFLEMS